MTTPRILLALLLLLTLTTSAWGYVTGNEYRGFRDDTRLAYVLGVLDGWQQIGANLAPPSKSPIVEPDAKVMQVQLLYVRLFLDLSRCAVEKQMTHRQTGAIVDKYVSDNPGEWHLPMAFVVFKAMIAACEK